LQAHSVFTACMARIVAARAGIAAEHAFLCGLLHDVGVSATLIALVEGENNVPESDALLTAIDGMHAQAGGMIAKLWNLSPSIANVINHHHPASSELSRAPALNAVLCVAERYADEYGFSLAEPTAIEPFDRQVPDAFEQSLLRLKLGPKISELRERAKEVAESME
jgi:putative nucleotidyltransferase with HDIG domain